MIQIFDTHAHYDDESFDDDRERLLAGFPAQGVHAVTNIGTNIRASEETVRMTEKYENLYGVVGIFPSEVAELENPDNVKRLKELAKHDKIVAIGEIGLDYHYEETDKALQHKWFDHAGFPRRGDWRCDPLLFVFEGECTRLPEYGILFWHWWRGDI